MLFDSFPYVFYFLPIVVALTFLVRKIGGLTAGPRAAQAVVLLASLFFYTWWKPIHLPYFTGIDSGQLVYCSPHRRIDRATA
jgi:alginate O-acetyltransferase complex protein AlgI